MNSTNHSRTLATLLVASTLLVACGGGSDADDDASEPGVSESEGGTDPGDDASPDAEDSGDADDVAPDEASPDDASPDDDGAVALPEPDEGVVDPVFHHVSAEAPAGSWGPLCNTDNQDQWAPGWRITVPTDWTRGATGGSNSFYDIEFNTPDGLRTKVDWTDSVESFGFTEGSPVGEIDFDGESVMLMDHSDETSSIFSIDFVAQSEGGSVEVTGTPAIHQVAFTAPVEMGMSSDAAAEILTTMRRERCAVLDDLALENAYALAPLFPIFDGGDPLGKTPPTSERLAYDAVAALTSPASVYTEDQLAYIVGYDQATSECFVANVIPNLPTEIEAIATYEDPITPLNETEVAAMQSALEGC